MISNTSEARDFYSSTDNIETSLPQIASGINSIAEDHLTQIEKIDINEGVYQALKKVVNAGVNQEAFTEIMIMDWYQQILYQDKSQSFTSKITDNEKISESVKQLQSKIALLRNSSSVTQMVEFLADIAHSWEYDNTFEPVTRKMIFLTQNYFLISFGLPMFNLSKKDLDSYSSLISDKFKLRLFLAEKVRETVFCEGQILYKIGGRYGSDKYHQDPLSKKTALIIEWPQLEKASEKWKVNLEANL